MREVDKGRDVRRGASRFSRKIKQSGYELLSGSNGVCGGGSVPLEKSKKERIKKLSAVNRASSSSSCHHICEMSCDASDREEEVPPQNQPSVNRVGSSSKRFKLPRKPFFDDCNGVDQKSVPRKLRSAMRKRCRELVSQPFPDSKKLNRTTGKLESSQTLGVKKLKRNAKQGGPDWSPEGGTCGPITKDEEEVVETLNALAGMFSDSAPHIKIKLECSDNSLALPEGTSCPQPAMEGCVAIKEELNPICLSKTEEVVHSSSNIERLPEGTIQVSSSNESIVQEPSNLCSSKKLCEGQDSSGAELNLHSTLAKYEELKPSCTSVDICVTSGLDQDTGKMKWPVKLDTSLLDRKPEISLDLITSIGSLLKQEDTIDESNRKGLSSMVSNGARSHGPSLQSSTVKIPAWLDTALCATQPTRSGTFQNGSSIGKVPKVYSDKRSWKRCAAHVYISRLIQVLQNQDSKDNLPVHTNQLKPNDILNEGVHMTINDFNNVRNGLNGVTSASSAVNTLEKNTYEARTGIIQRQKLHQNQALAGFAPGSYTFDKQQSFNFLSLSAGGEAVDAKSSSNKAGNGLEPMTQLQVPYIHPDVQYPTLIPFSISQTRFNSPAFPDQPPAVVAQQAHLQLPPPYHGTPLCGPLTSSTALKMQQPQHQQQQQLWAAQYRIMGISKAMTGGFPSWQNGRQDPTTMIPTAKAILSPSSSSLEVIGPKYPQISQQQQQLMTIASHLSSGYEETRSGFRTGGPLPLQLLCNESL